MFIQNRISYLHLFLIQQTIASVRIEIFLKQNPIQTQNQTENKKKKNIKNSRHSFLSLNKRALVAIFITQKIKYKSERKIQIQNCDHKKEIHFLSHFTLSNLKYHPFQFILMVFVPITTSVKYFNGKRTIQKEDATLRVRFFHQILAWLLGFTLNTEKPFFLNIFTIFSFSSLNKCI